MEKVSIGESWVVQLLPREKKKKSKNLLDLEERRPGVLPKPSRYIHLLAQKVYCWELLLGEHNHMQRHQSKLLMEISRFRRYWGSSAHVKSKFQVYNTGSEYYHTLRNNHHNEPSYHLPPQSCHNIIDYIPYLYITFLWLILYLEVCTS